MRGHPPRSPRRTVASRPGASVARQCRPSGPFRGRELASDPGLIAPRSYVELTPAIMERLEKYVYGSRPGETVRHVADELLAEALGSKGA